MIFDALRWVGLSWDEGPDVGGPFAPYRQSERAAIYRTHAEQLVAKGAAYRCFCTPERLQQVRVQQEAEKKAVIGYDRHCRNVPASDSEARAKAGEPFVIRLAVPMSGTVVVKDRLRGEVSFDWEQIDDQVLLKSDGMPTYHLANVVDDHLMEITHVIRAEEWISSTPKHVGLYQAFGWEEPQWFHMPLLRNPGGGKISKRKNPVSINYYRDAGILPQALLNFLALMGWSFGGDREKFTLAEMIEVFSWDRMSLGGPVFNLDKLTWLNEQYIHELSYEQLADELIKWRLNRDFLTKLLPLIRERIKKLDEVIPATEYFFSGDIDLKSKAEVTDELKKMKAAWPPAEIATQLRNLVEKLEAREGWDPKMLEAESRAWSDTTGQKSKVTFMLLRLVITGRKASPPLFDTMAVLGKEIVRRRLRVAADVIPGLLAD
jgi:glutamyl-tRNA synthetase